MKWGLHTVKFNEFKGWENMPIYFVTLPLKHMGTLKFKKIKTALNDANSCVTPSSRKLVNKPVS